MLGTFVLWEEREHVKYLGTYPHFLKFVLNLYIILFMLLSL